MSWLRGLIFTLTIYGGMGVMGVVGLPTLLSRDWTYWWMKLYCRFVFASARTIVGLRTEIRGPVPTGEVVIAAKHHSLLDVLMIFEAVPRAKFVMKRELVWVPVFGQYTLRIGQTPVNRAKKGASGDMLKSVEGERRERGQIVIYPQGTRTPPGIVMPFKKGAVLAYQRFGLPMVLCATNNGVFWPRRGVAKRPGVAVVEFLETVPPGLGFDEAMRVMQTRIDDESDRLCAEAERARLPAGATAG